MQGGGCSVLSELTLKPIIQKLQSILCCVVSVDITVIFDCGCMVSLGQGSKTRKLRNL